MTAQSTKLAAISMFDFVRVIPALEMEPVIFTVLATAAGLAFV